MALLNVISSRYPQLNSKGEPIRGGSVYLYEPGTTTFITSYRDSGLVTPHESPVKISGSGRANIWISRDCDLRIEDKNGNLIVEELNVNPDSLGADQAGGLISNGSFETDTDANNIPDGWVLVNETGSSNSIDSSESTDGSQSFRFTSAGTGGGSLTTEEFFPVNDADTLRVSVDLRSTVAGVQNIVRVEWYDISQVSISNSDIYDSTANPTTFTSQNLLAPPPTNARFAKLKLIGCDPAVAVAGSTFFDRVSAFYPALASGVFDNITIQNNEIISTNTNGDINLTPNGTGSVVITGASADLIRLTNTASVTLASINHAFQVGPSAGINLSQSGSQIQARNNGAASALNINTLGGDLQLGNTAAANVAIDSDGEITLSRAGGLTKLHTQLSGISVRGTLNNAVGGIQDPQIMLQGSGGVIVGEIAYLNTANMRIRNLNHGGGINLEAEDDGGVSRIIMAADPDGATTLRGNTNTQIQVAAGEIAVDCNANDSVDLYFDNAIRFKTTTAGTESQGTLFDFLTTGSNDVELICRNSLGGIQLRVSGGGAGRIDQVTSAGVLEKQWMTFARDGAIGIRNNNVEVAQTVTAALGGIRVNNTLTGAGFERVLTISDLGTSTLVGAVKTNRTVRASTTTHADDPDLSGVELEATASWLVEIGLFYNADSSGANGGFKYQLEFTGTASSTGTNIAREYYITDTSFIPPERLQIVGSSGFGLISINSDINGTNGIRSVTAKGIVRPTVTGDFSVQWAQETSNANGAVVQGGSYIRAERLD